MSQSISRRRALAGIATAAAVPVAALPALAATSGNDAELFRLERELIAAHTAVQAAGKLASDAERRYSALRPLGPERSAAPEEHADMYRSMTFGEFALLTKVQPNHPIIAWNRETEASYRARLADHQATCERLERETGSAEAEAAWAAGIEKMKEIGDRIFAKRASTLAGVEVKIRAYGLLDCADDPNNGGFASLAADISAMAKAAA